MFLTQKQYVNKKGLHCPFCGADCVTVTSPIDVNIEACVAFQDCRCTSCKHFWTDEYSIKLTGFTTEDNE